MSNKKPDLRFRDFTANWEERKLVDEFEKVNERNDGSFGINNWISVAKMYFQDPKKVQSNNIDTRTYVMRKGDIAFEGHPNTKFKFGRFVVNDIGPGVVSELFPIYRHMLDYDINYWKNSIQLEHIMAPIFAKSITSSGNSSNKLDTKHFLRQKIYIANFEEQQKIGTFFKRFDDSIALHQHALNLLKQRKKAFLQKMFPKKGECSPQIRFANYFENWGKRELGDLSEKVTKKNTKKIFTETFTNSAEHGIISQRDYFYKDISNKKNIDGYYIVKSNYFIYNPRISNFAPVGPIKRNKLGRTGIMSPLYYVFKTKNINTLFLDQYFLTSYWHDFMKKNGDSGARSDRFAIKNSDLIKMPIPYPSIEEQEKIGNFFNELEDSISLQEEKLESLKQMKKAFLQKMFV